jgi:transcriptional/translational regulatory protein YebC/TACO1
MGYLHLSAPTRSFDDIFEDAVLAGASDIEQTDDGIDVYCPVNTLHAVGISLVTVKGVTLNSQSIIMKPTMPIQINQEMEEEISEFISGLEELDDVSNVYTNAIKT